MGAPRAAAAALAVLLLLVAAVPVAAEALGPGVPQKQLEAKLASFALLVAAYIGLNSSLNLLNKWSLGVAGFRFPFLLTSCHMAFSFVVLAPVALRQPWKVHRRSLEKQWKGVLCIGSFLSIAIALNNLSLMDISLSLNQIIRSSIPVVTCVLSVVVERKRPSRPELAALLVLTSGVMLAVWQGRLAGKPYAVMFCALGTLCSGAMMTFSSKLMSEKLDVVRLTFYTAPVSLLCLAPFTLIYEWDTFLRYYPEHRSSVVVIIAVTSVNAVLYNLVHSATIKATSAVTTTVLGEVKIIGLLGLSALVLGESKHFTLSFSLGCALALVGFAMYSSAQLTKLRAALKPEAITIAASGGGGVKTVPVLQTTAKGERLPLRPLPR